MANTLRPVGGSGEQMSFTYTVLKKESFVVVAMAGAMDRSSSSKLEQCAQEVLTYSPGAAILHMQAVTSVKSECYRSFASLGKALKSSRIPFRYVGLESTVRKFLIDDGLISRAEIKDSMEGAMKELMSEAGLTRIG